MSDGTAYRLRGVEADNGHTCGVKIDCTVACWGSKDLVGQAEPPGGEFASVSAGSLPTCGAKTDRTVA